MPDEVEYKVVEVSVVTDDELTRVVNEWVGKGWSFDGFHFAMREASRRPAMAFALFVRAVRMAVIERESEPETAPAAAATGGSGSTEDATVPRKKVRRHLQ
jgi:hypothetical protein